MQGFNDNRDFGRTPPVNVGDELEVRIEAVGEKGDGVAKKDGFVLFVPNVKEGDNVRIKVTRVLRKVGFAEVIGKSEAPTEDQADQPEEAESSDEMPEETLPGPEEGSEDFGEEPLEESSGVGVEGVSDEDASKQDVSDNFDEESSEEPSEEDEDDNKKD